MIRSTTMQRHLSIYLNHAALNFGAGLACLWYSLIPPQLPERLLARPYRDKPLAKIGNTTRDARKLKANVKTRSVVIDVFTAIRYVTCGSTVYINDDQKRRLLNGTSESSLNELREVARKKNKIIQRKLWGPRD